MSKAVQNHVLYFCSCCAAVVLLFLTSFNLSSFLSKDRVLGVSAEEVEEQKLLEEKSFWQNFLSQNPTYLDGWVELTNIDLKLGNIQEAKGEYLKAKWIDPNSEKVLSLEKEFY